MKMLAKLIKINLLTFFDFKKTIPMILLYIYAFGFLGFSVYYGASFTLKALKNMELEHLLLVAAMSLSSFYLLLTTTFQVNKTLFNAKDYPLLLSLPIKKSTIILSKLFVLYFINFIFVLLLMVPTYLAYINGTVQSISFHVLFWLSFFFIPIIPTIIGALIGSLFTDVSSRFKYKNFVNILISVIFIFILFYFSYKMQNMTSIDFANLSKSLVDKLSAIYPLTTVYSNIIKETSIISLILFILISFISLYIFLLILSKFFDKINSRMNAITINNIYKDSDVKTNSPL
ncbi:MAG: hypothetical protein PHF21_04060, partial [Bacilli bacterium]|nr:hypothetical protein [Bacilli bacterium]